MTTTDTPRKTRASRASSTRKTTDAPVDTMTGKGKGGTVTQHGVTTTGYQRGCRCDLCKTAMSAYVAARRQARKVEADEVATKKAEKAARDKARRQSKKADAVVA